MIIHDFADPPACANNPDKTCTNNGGHLFVDAWHDTHLAIFDRSGFNALEICQYCGIYAAAKRPDSDTELVTYFAADQDSKRFALISGLDLKLFVDATNNACLDGASVMLTTEDFSLSELDDIANDARDYGYSVAPLALDEAARHHRLIISLP